VPHEHCILLYLPEVHNCILKYVLKDVISGLITLEIKSGTQNGREKCKGKSKSEVKVKVVPVL
jgi:hypothetical protein